MKWSFLLNGAYHYYFIKNCQGIFSFFKKKKRKVFKVPVANNGRNRWKSFLVPLYNPPQSCAQLRKIVSLQYRPPATVKLAPFESLASDLLEMHPFAIIFSGWGGLGASLREHSAITWQSGNYNYSMPIFFKKNLAANLLSRQATVALFSKCLSL